MASTTTTTLTIDNNNFDPQHPTYLSDASTTAYSMTVLQLLGKARLGFEPADIGTTGTGKVRHVTTLQGAGKFAWFIDIDSLKVYTQQELIPDGF